MSQLPDPVPTMGGLSFPVMVDGQRVAMRISDEALQDHFGASGDAGSLINAYRSNSSTIDAKAIEKHRAQPGVAVLLKTADFY